MIPESIETPGDTPPVDEVRSALDDPTCGRADDRLLEEMAGVPGPVALTPARPRASIRASRLKVRSTALAAIVSILIHAALALGAYWALRSLHIYIPAGADQVRGDGADDLGATDHAGLADADAGAGGTGSIRPGWSVPTAPGERWNLLDERENEAAGADAPFSAPPPVPHPLAQVDSNDEDLLDASDEVIPAPIPELQSSVTFESLPTFSRPPPGAASNDPEAIDPARDAGPAGGVGAGPVPASPAGPVAPAGNPGGSLQRPGAGGSAGGGGSTTGAGGAALTGRPGSNVGIIGNPPKPVYSWASLQMEEEGEVVLQVEVLADGKVGSIKVLADAGHPRLAESAIDAVRKTRFHPRLEDGVPVSSTFPYPFIFRLRR